MSEVRTGPGYGGAGTGANQPDPGGSYSPSGNGSGGQQPGGGSHGQQPGGKNPTRILELLAPVIGLGVLDAAGGGVLGAIHDVKDGKDDDTGGSHGDGGGGSNNGNGILKGLLPTNLAGGLIDDVTGVGGDGGLGNPTHVLGDLLCIDCLTGQNPVAPDGALGTVAGVENNFVDDFHALLEGSANQAGYPATPAVHSLTGFGEAVGFGRVGEQANLLTAIVEAPNAVLNGNAVDAVCDILDEVGDTIGAAGTFVNKLVDTVNLSNPLNAGVVSSAADLVGDLTGGLASGRLLDAGLLDPDGSGPGGNVIEALVKSTLSGPGALVQLNAAGDGNPSQSHNLVDLGVGPRDNDQGALNILNPGPGGNDGAIDVNVLNVGSDGPRLVDGDVATDPDPLSAIFAGGSGGALTGDGLLNLDLSDFLVPATGLGTLNPMQNDLIGV